MKKAFVKQFDVLYKRGGKGMARPVLAKIKSRQTQQVEAEKNKAPPVCVEFLLSV